MGSQRTNSHIEANPSAPVWVESGGYYEVRSHADVISICMQPEIFSSNMVAFVLRSAGGSAQLLEIPEGVPRPRDVLAIADAPAHTSQRKRLNPAFKRPALAQQRPAVIRLATRLAERFLPKGRVEWMSQFATQLPLSVISMILGLPEEDFDLLHGWSDAGVRIVDGTASGDDLQELAIALLAFQRYLSDAIESADERPPESLIAKIATMVRHGELEHDESVSILLQLVVAGSDSTASLLGALAHRLALAPELQTSLRANPEDRQAVIDEVLRIDAPFQGHFRVLLEDARVGGIIMPAGTRLMLHWGAANHDNTVFSQPDRFDPSRTELKRHLSFGYGIHRCIGAHLAQLEAEITLSLLVDSLPQLRLAPGFEAVIKPSVFTRRLDRLELLFDAQPCL